MNRTLMCIVLLLGCWINPGKGQEFSIKVAQSVYLSVSKTKLDSVPHINFKNINKVLLYENKNLKRRIDALFASRSRDYEQMDKLLTEYVSNFGIKNFSQAYDLNYIWKLAQVKEVLGDTSLALFFYGIALKNHSRFYRSIKLHFDALRSMRSSDYVDIDYYHKILAARIKADTIKPPAGILINMGERINSKFPDYAPYMHPSGQRLIFTSRRSLVQSPSGINFDQNEDLYFAELDPRTGRWTNAKPFPAVINSSFNEGSACLSNDGKQLYFVRCNQLEKSDFGMCDIYLSNYDDEKKTWKKPVNLGPNVNSPYWDSHPSLSPDGSKLYFASNRPDGFGRTDLYLCRKQRDGTWSKAENLGPIINTIEDEVSPFLHPVNNTLYFSSTGHFRNTGGYDIYKSRQLPDSTWEEPINLGPLINTKRDEYYFSIDQQGDTLFYASAAPDNPKNMDIYSFPMPMTARPDAIYLLNGYMIDSASGNPITGIMAAVDLDKNTQIVPVRIAPNGYFEFRLVNDRKYKLIVLGENALKVPDDVKSVPQDTLNKVFDKSASLFKPIVFENLEFKSNSGTLTPTIEQKLDVLVEYFKQNPRRKLIVSGHSDSDGDPDFNQSLSRLRAENIKKYLLQKLNAPDSMIRAEGYGDKKPIFPNNSRENKARNRRVEFEVIPSPEELAKMYRKRGDEYPVELPPEDEKTKKKDNFDSLFENDKSKPKNKKP